MRDSNDFVSRPSRSLVITLLCLCVLVSACAAELGVVNAPPVQTDAPETVDAVETVMVDGIPVRTDGLRAAADAYRVDVMTLDLVGGEGREYKYRLEEGQTMLFSWESSGPVRVEMHSQADDQEQREGAAEFFEVLLSATSGHGTFTAPFPGIHGWWWLNLSDDETVTVTVRSSGFYSHAIEFPSQEQFELEPVNE